MLIFDKYNNLVLEASSQFYRYHILIPYGIIILHCRLYIREISYNIRAFNDKENYSTITNFSGAMTPYDTLFTR